MDFRFFGDLNIRAVIRDEFQSSSENAAWGNGKKRDATAHSSRVCFLDPIPGGCNLEFNLEVDPNIYLEYNLVDTRIKFAPANLGSTRCVWRQYITNGLPHTPSGQGYKCFINSNGRAVGLTSSNNFLPQ